GHDGDWAAVVRGDPELGDRAIGRDARDEVADQLRDPHRSVVAGADVDRNAAYGRQRIGRDLSVLRHFSDRPRAFAGEPDRLPVGAEAHAVRARVEFPTRTRGAVEADVDGPIDLSVRVEPDDLPPELQRAPPPSAVVKFDAVRAALLRHLVERRRAILGHAHDIVVVLAGDPHVASALRI